jgi:catechol 2,3-dioxygenase-like lactoylglutathione lyase family enzyme
MMNKRAVVVRRLMAGVVVDDLQAARAWYETVLGQAPDAAPMDGLLEWHVNDGAWLQVVDVQIVRAVQRRDGWGCAGASSVSFVVENLDDQRATFAANAIPIVSQYTTASALKTVTVSDPAGNFVTFVEEPERVEPA